MIAYYLFSIVDIRNMNHISVLLIIILMESIYSYQLIYLAKTSAVGTATLAYVSK